MKNVGNVLRMKIEKIQKDTKYKHRLSEKVGKDDHFDN